MEHTDQNPPPELTELPCESANSPELPQFHVQQFGLGFLLAWAAVAAALLGVRELLALISRNMSFWGPPASELDTLQKVIMAMFAIIYSAELVAFVVLLRSLLKHKNWHVLRRLQPGHWLILITIFYSFLLILWLATASMLSVIVPNCSWPTAIIAFTFLGISLCCWVMATWLIPCSDIYWQLFFGVMTISHVLLTLPFMAIFCDVNDQSFIVNIGGPFSCICFAMALVLFMAAFLDDLISRTPRDWLHRLSIRLVIFAILLLILITIASAV